MGTNRPLSDGCADRPPAVAEEEAEGGHPVRPRGRGGRRSRPILGPSPPPEPHTRLHPHLPCLSLHSTLRPLTILTAAVLLLVVVQTDRATQLLSSRGFSEEAQLSARLQRLRVEVEAAEAAARQPLTLLCQPSADEVQLAAVEKNRSSAHRTHTHTHTHTHLLPPPDLLYCPVPPPSSSMVSPLTGSVYPLCAVRSALLADVRREANGWQAELPMMREALKATRLMVEDKRAAADEAVEERRRAVLVEQEEKKKKKENKKKEARAAKLKAAAVEVGRPSTTHLLSPLSVFPSLVSRALADPLSTSRPLSLYCAQRKPPRVPKKAEAEEVDEAKDDAGDQDEHMGYGRNEAEEVPQSSSPGEKPLHPITRERRLIAPFPLPAGVSGRGATRRALAISAAATTTSSPEAQAARAPAVGDQKTQARPKAAAPPPVSTPRPPLQRLVRSNAAGMKESWKTFDFLEFGDILWGTAVNNGMWPRRMTEAAAEKAKRTKQKLGKKGQYHNRTEEDGEEDEEEDGQEGDEEAEDDGADSDEAVNEEPRQELKGARPTPPPPVREDRKKTPPVHRAAGAISQEVRRLFIASPLSSALTTRLTRSP